VGETKTMTNDFKMLFLDRFKTKKKTPLLCQVIVCPSFIAGVHSSQALLGYLITVYHLCVFLM